MYRIECADGDQWKILDESHSLVFVGTKRQAEDWLDHRENIQRQPSPRISVGAVIEPALEVLRRLVGRSPVASKPRPAPDSTRSRAGHG
jgi:hypothetical protein